MAKLYSLDKSFKIIKEVENVATFLDLNDSFNNIILMPFILSKPDLFREMVKMIYETYIEDKKEIKPFVFISSLSWFNAKNRINSKNVNVIDDFVKMHQYCSFIFNSSIWIHFVEIEFYDGKVDAVLTKNNYKNIVDTIHKLKIHNCFKDERNNNISIFETFNAKENIEYQFRLQQNNFLSDVGAHGKNITPFIYSDEYQCLESIKEINKKDEKRQLEPKYDKHEIQLYNNARFNILLVDDKKEKGLLIEELLNHFTDPDFTKNTVWNDGKVKCSFFKQGQDKYKDENDSTYLSRIEEFAKDSDFEDYTKIFHVTTVKDAVRLLSADKIGDTSIRFDLIMLDFLLDYKDGSKTEREYSSRLFEWLTNNKNDESDSFGLGQTDKELIRAIKNNRGPLQKLWFFPITAFNQTFIDNLRNDSVRLIDYYWHISRGADPINTPYLFLRNLNSFLYLHLQQAVFDLNTLISFLTKTTERLKTINFKDFQAHMGSEYTVLIQKHGWRSVISRDAKAGSLFSKFIWENFYAYTPNKYLFRLMDKMQKFFHVCTFADETDYDKMMLYWKELDIFISDYWKELTDGTIDEIIRPDLSGFRDKINKFLDKNKN